MPKVDVVNLDNQVVGQLELADEVFAAPVNQDLLYEAVRHYQACRRAGTHKTKERGSVAGSGKKLWKQKGTGRARMGSIKAPQRRHGAIVHGPHPRDHSIGINKKARKAALRGALGERIRQNGLIVIDQLAPETHKTKGFAAWLKRIEAPSVLIVVDEAGENLVRATQNLPTVELIHYTQLNVVNLLRRPKTLITRAALERVQERIAP